jgi:predicted alpha/beta-hydrolase family hydrolase
MHQPKEPNGKGMVLTHGAGGNCKAPLLVAVADAFCAAGYQVLRCDMAFRQHRSFGPPSPVTSKQDRDSLREAVVAMRKHVSGALILGGQSYGGRQATMLASEDPGVAQGLLLLSYPLHPPGRAAQLRTAHFPALRTPSLFVHGTKDPFGKIEEIEAALALIPAKTKLVIIEGVGHDLGRGKFDMTRLLGPLAAAQTEHHA